MIWYSMLVNVVDGLSLFFPFSLARETKLGVGCGPH